MNIHNLFTAALEASWQGSLAILFILALRPLLGSRIPAGWRSLLWTLALIRLLVPASVLPQSPASMQNIAGGEQSVQRVRLVWTAGQTAEPETAIAASPVTNTAIPESGLDWWKLAAQVWLGGVCILGAWLFGGAMSLRRRLARENTEVDETVARVWRACCERVAVRRPPRLIATDAITSPALVGIIRPMLLLPRRDQEKLSREDCEHIFLHELAHYRRGDHWTHLRIRSRLCVHCFNPIVWLGFRCLRADRELAADEWALHHLAPEHSTAYGATLLRLLSAQTAPAFPRSAIGILEDGSQIKERLRRIVAFRPRRLGGSIAGLTLVAGMAAIILTAAESTVGALSGWSVVSISIPKNGEIKDAYVELKSPAGRRVTVTKGVTTTEGVTLAEIEWSGSPIRAVVTVRKGSERAELSADAGVISKKNDLSKKTAQVEIEAKFIELADEMAKEMPLLNFQPSNLPRQAGADASKAPFGALAGVITADQLEVLLRALNQKKGVDLLSSPRVTTLSQQRAVIEIIREYRYPTAWDPPDTSNQHWTPNNFETRNVGLTLGVEATLVDDDTIDLNLSPEVVEFLGLIDHETKKPVAKSKHKAGTPLMERALDPSTEPGAKLSDRVEPVFHTRKNTTSVTIYSGQSVILILGDTEQTPFPRPSAGKTVVALITARRMEPQEPPKSAANVPASTTVVLGEGVPAARPVPNKPGYVTSPHSPKSGYIDVRGFSSGTEVKDPYSGKMFRVP